MDDPLQTYRDRLATINDALRIAAHDLEDRIQDARNAILQAQNELEDRIREHQEARR